MQEATRVIVGIQVSHWSQHCDLNEDADAQQVFAVGVELPKFYASRHWRSVAMMLGPVMTFGWLVCAGFVTAIFRTSFATALVVAACLTPTDPVLASSILSNSQFSERVPKRIKDLLSAESGCNDGISFPFLYIALYLVTQPTVGSAVKEWFLLTILWQCIFGTTVGIILGWTSNKILRFSDNRGYIDASGFTVFYLLLALLCVGIASTLGSDDFLVAFGAGYGFARDGWFSKKDTCGATTQHSRPVTKQLVLRLPWHDNTLVFLPTSKHHAFDYTRASGSFLHPGPSVQTPPDRTGPVQVDPRYSHLARSAFLRPFRSHGPRWPLPCHRSSRSFRERQCYPGSTTASIWTPLYRTRESRRDRVAAGLLHCLRKYTRPRAECVSYEHIQSLQKT